VPRFAYEAVDTAGKRTRGRLTAPTLQAVRRELEIQGLLPLDVAETREDPTTSLPLFGRRSGVLEFTRAVAALLPAGMPLARCLGAGADSAPPALRPALESVRTRVERGDALADALEAVPGLFSSVYVGVVRAGEKSGGLDGAFERLADHLERQDELSSKLVSMAIYPALLAVVGVAATLLLVLFVLPRFGELLTSSGSDLPPLTAGMMALVQFASDQWVWILAVPVVLFVALGAARATEAGRTLISEVVLRIPLVGGMRREALAAGFSRILGELLAGGAPLLASLEDARDSLGDPVVRREIERVRVRIREGGSLRDALSAGAVFPPGLGRMVQLGEESGRLADFTLKAAEMHERRTERALERLVAFAEPAMILVFGVVVGLVALALLQAIYGVNAGAL
jgi:type II secretory pathway component PulF